MADYKELLRRAIASLPENNGAARRAVYEKARSALVNQLRAIDPPLPARDITQHRLQLEDCIRQVETEASEAMIGRVRGDAEAERATVPAVQGSEVPSDRLEPEPEQQAIAEPPQQDPPPPEPIRPVPPRFDPPRSEPVRPEPAAPVPAARIVAPTSTRPPGGESIEDIIAAAEANREERPAAPPPASFSPAATAEPAAPQRQAKDFERAPAPEMPPAGGMAEERAAPEPDPEEAPPRKPGFKLFPMLSSRKEPKIIAPAPVPVEAISAAAAAAEPAEAAPAQPPRPQPVEPALSSVREVELDVAPAPVAAEEDRREAEGAIERAIETLDRAARGETTPLPASAGEPDPTDAVAPFPRTALGTDEAEPGTIERRASSGLTIFLIVFALLLAGVGGAGFWAWREGYIDLDQMFGRTPLVAEATDTQADGTTGGNGPTLDVATAPPEITPPGTTTTDTTPAEPTGPGNTATGTGTTEPTTALEGVVSEDRLTPDPQAGDVDAAGVSSPAADDTERLAESVPGNTLGEDITASVDPNVLAGSQSLLLEAAESGQSGAVPFSGTVEWSEGQDEVGLPTLVASASIPARNLGVEMTIRRNSDPSLPASHLMEVDFSVSDTFVGGAISSLPGVLLKDEELVQGTPLIGASARVVGNSFLFALSASEADVEINSDLLENRRWIDLAIVYATGRRAIITLEKDEEAEALFADVFTQWNAAASAE